MKRGKQTYKRAGVDIEKGGRAVKLMKESIRSTFRPEVLTEIGGFAGLFAFNKGKYREPVLVSATDGVGTKLKIAQTLNKHDTVGIDLVAMCVDDIVCYGAEPLFFLDYIACGKLIPEKIAEIVEGIAEGCKQAGCALLGGETAEMPGFYADNEYDLAGFAVGVVEKSKIIDGSRIVEGDIILGLASSGLHSNGYSLVRQVLLEEAKLKFTDIPVGLNTSLGNELIIPTRIYTPSLFAILPQCEIHGLAHITGGGLVENTPRILPRNLDAAIDSSAWQAQPIFGLIQERGGIDFLELYRTFNMGIGMVIILSRQEITRATKILVKSGEKVYRIGEIIKGKGKVVLSGLPLG